MADIDNGDLKDRVLSFQGTHKSTMGCFPCVGRRGKTFHVKILLLDKQELIEEVKHERTTGQDLLDSVFAHLNLIETAYFGLRYQDSSNQTVGRRRLTQRWRQKQSENTEKIERGKETQKNTYCRSCRR